MIKRCVLSIMVASTVTAGSFDNQTGSVVVGTITLPDDLHIEDLRAVSESDASYVRGVFQKYNAGQWIYEKRLIGHEQTADGCEPVVIGQPIFTPSAVDWNQVVSQLDPDGPGAGSCAYEGVINGEHTVRDTNSWCETRFTKHRVGFPEELIPIHVDQAQVREAGKIDRDSIESTVVERSDVELGPEAPVKVNDYEKSTDQSFTIEASSLFTSSSIGSLDEANQANFWGDRQVCSSNPGLTLEQVKSFESYAQYPRTGSRMLVRGSTFTVGVRSVDDGRTVQIEVTPDFWDSSLPACEAPSYEASDRCNAGYDGSVDVWVGTDRGVTLFDRTVALTTVTQ